MDSRQRAEKQIRLVLVMYRVEVRRRDRDEMVRFRNRARAIFDYLAAKFADDPALMALLLEARWSFGRNHPHPEAAPESRRTMAEVRSAMAKGLDDVGRGRPGRPEVNDTLEGAIKVTVDREAGAG